MSRIRMYEGSSGVCIWFEYVLFLNAAERSIGILAAGFGRSRWQVGFSRGTSEALIDPLQRREGLRFVAIARVYAIEAFPAIGYKTSIRSNYFSNSVSAFHICLRLKARGRGGRRYWSAECGQQAWRSCPHKFC